MISSIYDIKNCPPELGTFIGQQLKEDDLSALRYQLYHSAQPGIIRFPNFLSTSQTEHVRNVWTTPGIEKRFEPLDGVGRYVGCPNSMAQREGGNATYFNMSWAPTYDEFTKTLAISLQILRNRLEGKLPYGELFGDVGKAMSFRMVHSRNHPDWIEEHTDYYDPENPLDSLKHDLSRLQITVVFSEKGKDYRGEGFSFKDNTGRWLNIGDDVPALPGDVFVWRYINPHRVGSIVSDEHQLGFLRMLMPPEDLKKFSDVRQKSKTVKEIERVRMKLSAITYGLKLKTKSILRGEI